MTEIKSEPFLTPCPKCGVPDKIPHLTDGRCAEALKRLVVNANDVITNMRRSAEIQNRAMWVIADREGGRVRVSKKEMDAIPKGGRILVNIDPTDPGSFWIVADTKPEKGLA